MSYRPIEKQVLFSGKKVRLELHPGAVVILAFVDSTRIILIRNRRYTVGEILLELPAGTLEKGEDPMNCAGRELVEETGFLAGRLMPLGNFYTSPGVLSEKMYAFAAYDLQATQTDLEEGEEIETYPVALDEAIEMIRDGRIHDGKTIATLLLYDRFYRRK
jgi:ADP-ribose pyrophosphatase